MSKNLILVVMFSIATVVFWISLEVFFGLTSTELDVNYDQYLVPMSSSFDQEAIDEVLEREEEYLIVERDGLE